MGIKHFSVSIKSRGEVNVPSVPRFSCPQVFRPQVFPQVFPRLSPGFPRFFNHPEIQLMRCTQMAVKEMAKNLILFDGFDWLAGKIAGVSGSGSLGGPTLDVSLEGVEKAGGAIAVDVAAQKAVRGAPRSTGQKVSLSMVGKTAAKVGKIAGWAGTLLTANDGRSAFQRCMSNQD